MFSTSRPALRCAVLLTLLTLAGAQCELEQLVPSGPSHAQFGHSVALSGDRLAVGRIGDQGAQPVPGRVYTYRRQAGSWEAEAILAPPMPMTGDGFGYALALQDARLVVGAVDLQGRGTVYIYEDSANAWLLRATLTSPGPLRSDRFGWSVGLDGVASPSVRRRGRESPSVPASYASSTARQAFGSSNRC